MHKKAITFTLLSSMLFLFSSCNSNEDDESLVPDIAYLGNLPYDIIYKDRHYQRLMEYGVKDTIGQESIGELLGYIIRENDIDAFKVDYPNVDYVIDNHVYYQDYQYRVPFFKVVGYDDLSFICVIKYLYQEITDFPQ